MRMVKGNMQEYSVNSKSPKILNTIFHTFFFFFFLPYILLFMQLFFFFLILSGIANSADPDQTAPSFRSSLVCVCTVCICHLSETLMSEILGHLLYPI